MHLPSERTFTHQQAEFFIAQQARLIQNDDQRALSPSMLQEEIAALRETNPDLAETVRLQVSIFPRKVYFLEIISSK